jgi:hypothetical protein
MPMPSMGQQNQVPSPPSTMSIANHIRLRAIQIPRTV